METTATPRWREALTSEDHELYTAAWLIFSKRVPVPTVSEQLTDQKEMVVPFLVELLEDDYLFEMGAPGDGEVHERAVLLLGEWQVREKLDVMLDQLLESEAGDNMYDGSISAISKLGPEVIDDLLEWVEENPEYKIEIAEVLSRMPSEDERAFNTIVSWLSPENEDDIELFIDFLVDIDLNKTIPAVEQAMKHPDFSDEQKSVFKERLKELRKELRDMKKKKK